jgi:hypothetical protein
VKRPLEITYEALRRLPARTVRTVMECSGSDANYFEYFQGMGQKPLRCEEAMILSAGEFTGVPLAAVLEQAGIGKGGACASRRLGSGCAGECQPGHEALLLRQRPALEKALHPDTILAWAMNGNCWNTCMGLPYAWWFPAGPAIGQSNGSAASICFDSHPIAGITITFITMAASPNDPNKELITTIGVKSIVTFPRMIRRPCRAPAYRTRPGLSGGAITRVEVSVDGGRPGMRAP